MRKSYLVFALFFLLISCAKDADPAGALFGTYAGGYLQSGAIKDTAVVRIVFVGSNFSGESTGGSRSICNGSYQVTGDSINFINGCSTPDADLLLAGKYQMRMAGDSLFFTRISNGIIYYEEQFSLKKQ